MLVVDVSNALSLLLFQKLLCLRGLASGLRSSEDSYYYCFHYYSPFLSFFTLTILFYIFFSGFLLGQLNFSYECGATRYSITFTASKAL